MIDWTNWVEILTFISVIFAIAGALYGFYRALKRQFHSVIDDRISYSLKNGGGKIIRDISKEEATKANKEQTKEIQSWLQLNLKTFSKTKHKKRSY